MSAGRVAGARGKAAARLAPFTERVRALLRLAEVLHVNETTASAEGDLAYLHVACTEFLTHLRTGGRSAAGIDAGGVLPATPGPSSATATSACLGNTPPPHPNRT